MFSVTIRDSRGQVVASRNGYPTRDLAARVGAGYVREACSKGKPCSYHVSAEIKLDGSK